MASVLIADDEESMRALVARRDGILSVPDIFAIVMDEVKSPTVAMIKGKETIRKTMAARFKTIPDMRWDHKEYIYAGNRAISIWTVRGKGADGEDLNYQGCDIYTFRGGKICAKDTYWKIVEHKDRL